MKMRAQTFYDWLQREVTSSRMALVGLYESRDKLKYVDAPKLRKRYMDIFGAAETPVLEAELELSLLRRKLELMQIAINRREPIDMERIEATLAEEKRKKIAEVEGADLTLNELPQLSESEQRTLQRQYREITAEFHPAMNRNLTDAQRDLYDKAAQAYRMQDVEAMKVIYDALFSPVDLGGLSISLGDGGEKTSEERRADYRKLAVELGTDYRLARELYECFVPLEEDGVVRDALAGYDAQRREVEAEIARIREGFPFNAVSTMDSPERTEEYLAELRLRARRYAEEKAELEGQIARMLEAHAHG